MSSTGAAPIQCLLLWDGLQLFTCRVVESSGPVEQWGSGVVCIIAILFVASMSDPLHPMQAKSGELQVASNDR